MGRQLMLEGRGATGFVEDEDRGRDGAEAALDRGRIVNWKAL